MLEIAHGIVGRTDLPIPEWLFGWGAAMVLVVSFVALAVLWPEPRLQDGGFRPFPRRVSRVLLSRPVEILCGAIGVFLLGLTIYSGLAGSQTATAQLRALLRVRDLLARARPERPVRGRVPAVQPVAGDRPDGRGNWQCISSA